MRTEAFGTSARERPRASDHSVLPAASARPRRALEDRGVGRRVGPGWRAAPARRSRERRQISARFQSSVAQTSRERVGDRLIARRRVEQRVGARQLRGHAAAELSPVRDVEHEGDAFPPPGGEARSAHERRARGGRRGEADPFRTACTGRWPAPRRWPEADAGGIRPASARPTRCRRRPDPRACSRQAAGTLRSRR